MDAGAAAIAQAQGIVMARYGFDSRSATLWMLRQAADLGLTVEHIATAVVFEVELRAQEAEPDHR